MWVAVATVRRSVLAGALAALAIAWASVSAHGQDAGEGRANQTSETVAAEAAPADEERSFTWDLSWAGWKGLQYELLQRSPSGDRTGRFPTASSTNASASRVGLAPSWPSTGRRSSRPGG